jgi:hypothetical protein
MTDDCVAFRLQTAGCVQALMSRPQTPLHRKQKDIHYSAGAVVISQSACGRLRLRLRYPRPQSLASRPSAIACMHD